MTPIWQPLIIAVAPSGARRTKKDHARLPITPEELAETAAACQAQGAAMLHLHVRDSDGAHLLDAHAYRAAISAIGKAVGRKLVLQITTEAVGRYRPGEQMSVVRAVLPEAVSLALKEIVPDASAEKEAADFFAWLRRERIMAQIVLYSPEELTRYYDLRNRGVIAEGPDFLLFVLGRYTQGQRSAPADLLPFLAVHAGTPPWAMCAFGALENACAVTAAALGGHVRVGFENNLLLADGAIAPDNAALVRQVAEGARQLARPLGNAEDLRALYR